MSPLYKFEPDFAVHPGATLREKLDELQISAKEFAVRTGKPEQTISKILNEKSAITPDMAVQFENVLKIPANFWLDMQADYDEYMARKKQEQRLQPAKEWAKKFPYTAMAKAGWVKNTRRINERVKELLNFFNISHPGAWEEIYLNQALPISFRASLKNNKTPYATSVLLRYGEQQAGQMDLAPYNKQKLKEILPVLKQIMVQNEPYFLQKVQKLCADAGIAVIFTRSFPKTGLYGVVRWHKNNPVILMTDRQKRYDMFWFSFFHELGHVYLHGQKKNIFLEEELDATGKDDKELEADAFAARWLLNDKEFEMVKTVFELRYGIRERKDAVEHFARKFNTHPAIIIGRLLHDDKTLYQQGWVKYIPKIDFDQLLTNHPHA